MAETTSIEGEPVLKVNVNVTHESDTDKMIVFTDDLGNEIGSLVTTPVVAGLRVELWHADDTHAETVVLRS